MPIAFNSSFQANIRCGPRLLWKVEPKDVEKLSDRLKAPSEPRELALLASRNRSALSASKAPQELLDVLKRTDAFRRPERFKDLLEALPIDGARLEKALAAAAEVDAGAIAAHAASPQETARLIDEARLQAIARAA